MKLNHPAKRLTAALLSGAMLFTLCAPALAADTGTAPDPVSAAAAPLDEENGSERVSFTINNVPFSPSGDSALEAQSNFNGFIFYTSSTRTLTFQGNSTAALTIDAPGVNVKIIGSASSTDSPLISGDLTITHSASVYISNMENDAVSSKQAITGSANITSDGAVTIYGTDRAVGGEKLTVDADGDVKIANNQACAAIWKNAEITSRSGSVTIGSNNAGGWAQGTLTEGGSLIVTAADDVTLTGGSSTEPVVQNPTIKCGGTLTIENTVGQSSVSGSLTYTNSSDQETVLRKDGNFYGAIASGKSTTLSDPAGVKKFTAAPEEKVPLELKDCYAVNESGNRGSSFYKGETVTVYAQRPDNGMSVRRWTITPSVTLSNDTISDGTDLNWNEIRFSMPAEKTAITAVWDYYTETSQKLDIEWRGSFTAIGSLTPDIIEKIDSHSVKIGDSSTDNYLTVTYEDGVYVITGTPGGSCDALNLTGYHGTDDVLPSVKFVSNGYILNSLDIDGLQNFTATDLCQQRPGTDGSMSIRCSGNVNINSNEYYAVYCGGDVTITSGGDVTITNNGNETGKALYSGGTFRITSGGEVKITSPYRAVSGGNVIIDCAGDLALTSTTTNSGRLSQGTVSVESFTISNAQNVVISSANTNQDSTSLSATTASISCSGNVEITGANNAVWSESFRISDAQNVTVRGKNRAFEGYTGTIHCSGNVSLTGENDVAVMSSHFTIDNADQVTLTAATAAFRGTVSDDYSGIPGDFLDTPVADITCSGDVELKTTGGSPLVCTSYAPTATLTYHQADSSAYQVWAGKSSADNTLLTDAGTAGQSFTLTNTDSYSYAKITPDLPDIPDSSAGSDRSGDIGGAIAAVAVGGAAVWGGYEVATRVILNKLLPEGAAIPANRGALALLVWNTAGRPAPAAQPAFADVADPDTAAAAQWCVEQGLLDSRDGSFKPDGRVSKFRVIQVWNKAFPKP